jgi:hypothetical protein
VRLTIKRKKPVSRGSETGAAAQDWRIPGGGGIMSLQGVSDERN